MNQNIVDQFAERIINETNSAISCLTLYLGHKLDLFNSLKKEGPITSEELSKKTKYSKRYLREWLECMTVSNYPAHKLIYTFLKEDGPRAGEFYKVPTNMDDKRP
jgi:hypothetical protein